MDLVGGDDDGRLTLIGRIQEQARARAGRHLIGLQGQRGLIRRIGARSVRTPTHIEADVAFRFAARL